MTISRIAEDPQITQGLDWDRRPIYRKNAPPCQAIVATDYSGEYVTVLEFIGSGLDYIAECENISEFFRDNEEFPGAGIWMWVGKVTSDNHEGEYEYGLCGSYRPLTKEEIKQSMSGDSPWDPDLWYDRAAMDAREGVKTP